MGSVLKDADVIIDVHMSCTIAIELVELYSQLSSGLKGHRKIEEDGNAIQGNGTNTQEQIFDLRN